MTTPSPTQPERDALEAAARAIFPLMAEEVTGRAPVGGYDQALGIDQQWMREAAEAAIHAYLTTLSERGMRVMPRDPTDAMHREGMATRQMQDNLNKAYHVIIDTSDIWRSMFDAFDPNHNKNPQSDGGKG